MHPEIKQFLNKLKPKKRQKNDKKEDNRQKQLWDPQQVDLLKHQKVVKKLTKEKLCVSENLLTEKNQNAFSEIQQVMLEEILNTQA